jgi:hypothetical protein
LYNNYIPQPEDNDSSDFGGEEGETVNDDNEESHLTHDSMDEYSDLSKK